MFVHLAMLLQFVSQIWANFTRLNFPMLVWFYARANFYIDQTASKIEAQYENGEK
jgi:hypothetical protein